MEQLPRIDKSVLTTGSIYDEREEDKFWQSHDPKKRMEAIELNRRMVYGENRTTSRLQRFLETSKLSKG